MAALACGVHTKPTMGSLSFLLPLSLSLTLPLSLSHTRSLALLLPRFLSLALSLFLSSQPRLLFSSPVVRESEQAMVATTARSLLGVADTKDGIVSDQQPRNSSSFSRVHTRPRPTISRSLFLTCPQTTSSDDGGSLSLSLSFSFSRVHKHRTMGSPSFSLSHTISSTTDDGSRSLSLSLTLSHFLSLPLTLCGVLSCP